MHEATREEEAILFTSQPTIGTVHLQPLMSEADQHGQN